MPPLPALASTCRKTHPMRKLVFAIAEVAFGIFVGVAAMGLIGGGFLLLSVAWGE